LESFLLFKLFLRPFPVGVVIGGVEIGAVSFKIIKLKKFNLVNH
jgi:hypothetical protein